MNKKIIEGTLNTPEIIFKYDVGVIVLNGYSLPEYDDNFYDKIDKEVQKFLNVNKENITIIFNLVFMNTYSNKRIFHLIKNCKENVNNLNVIWRYAIDDDDMLEQGEFYESSLGMKFQFISYNENDKLFVS